MEIYEPSSSSSSSFSLISSSLALSLSRMMDCSIAATVQSTTLSVSKLELWLIESQRLLANILGSLAFSMVSLLDSVISVELFSADAFGIGDVDLLE